MFWAGVLVVWGVLHLLSFFACVEHYNWLL